MTKAISDKSYKLQSIRIFSSTGQSTDITSLLKEASIFEDLYNNTVSGKIVLEDALDLITEVPLLGFETLEFSFAKDGEKKELAFSRLFRIYKIDNVQVDPNQKVQTYTLRFSSEENMLSSTTIVTKAYKGKKTEEIIKDIAKISFGRLFEKKFAQKNIHTSAGTQDVVICGWAPFHAIQWLTRRTVGNYMFFENSEGYNFKSIDKMIQAPAERSFTYTPQNLNISGLVNAPESKETVLRDSNVIKWEYSSLFDVMGAVNNGMFASTLSMFDPIRLEFSEVVFNYDDETEKNKRLDDKFGRFHNGALDRFSNKITAESAAVRRYYPTTRDLKSDAVITADQPNIQDNFVDQWMLQRMSRIEEINYFKLKLLIPGTNTVAVGDVIEFKMPRIMSKDRKTNDDHPYYRGRYLITAMRHQLTQNSYEVLLEVVKDCTTKPYPTATEMT
jgi:hypothetical protein